MLIRFLTAAARIAGNAAGIAAALVLAAPAGSATGAGNASGAAPALILSAPAGNATGGGAGMASGIAPALTLAAPAGPASGAATAAGLAPPLVLSAPAGSAAAGTAIPGAASGAAPALDLSPPAGAATGAAAASGAAPVLTLAAPGGTIAAGGSATGSAPALDLIAPAGGAVGGQPTPGNASGAAPTLTLTAPAGTAGRPVAAGRDTDVLKDVQARLVATGCFDAVNRYGPDEWPPPPEQVAAAFVEPYRFDEVYQLGGTVVTRRLEFLLTILVRDRDPTARNERLDYLYARAVNVLAGRALAGVTVPLKTRVGKGKYLPAKGPERALQVIGYADCLVPDFAGHDAANPDGF